MITEQNMLLYKSFLIFKASLLAAFVWFFEPLYNMIILSGLLPEGAHNIMLELRELIGILVGLMVAFKLAFQIKKLNKEK